MATSSMLTCILCLLIFQTCTSTFLEELISQNMQFKCEYDICTVGRHFCSLEDRACVPCDEDVCNEPDSPSMCKAYCTDYDQMHKLSSSAAPARETTTPTEESDLQPLCLGRWGILIMCCGYAIALLACLITVFFCLWHRRKKQRDEYNPPIQAVQENSTSKLVTNETDTHPKDIINNVHI